MPESGVPQATRRGRSRPSYLHHFESHDPGMKKLDAEAFLTAISLQANQSRHPEGVTFELTYGCNLRCVHCFNPTHRALPQELKTCEVLQILDQLAAFGVLTVTFTGGEPTLRPD